MKFGLNLVLYICHVVICRVTQIRISIFVASVSILDFVTVYKIDSENGFKPYLLVSSSRNTRSLVKYTKYLTLK